MHMADALISPIVGGTMWGLSLGILIYACKKIKGQSESGLVPLMGIMGAFVFAAQMINFTIPGTGSGGHLIGGLLLAILLGPYSSFIVIASILTIQAFFFADGGIVALGCNIFNLGFFSSFIIYPFIYTPLVKGEFSRNKIFLATVISAVLSLQLAAFSVVLETFLSGIISLPFKTFVLLMQPIHLAVGFVEGLVTAFILIFLYKTKPELFQEQSGFSGSKEKIFSRSLKTVCAYFFILTFICLGVLSWNASELPDGLEWAIQKSSGQEKLESKNTFIHNLAFEIQKKTGFLPDYSFKQE